MRYLLAVLTHGDNADVITRTIQSFRAMVTPAPTRQLVVMDGVCALPPIDPDIPYGEWNAYPIPDAPVGFSRAVHTMWRASVACTAVDYVFWLEHDFTFDRPVDLRDMAAILDEQPTTIAQVSLMRQPIAPREIDAGGVLADQIERGQAISYHRAFRYPDRDGGPIEIPWVEHAAYYTTNPNLMRRDFMQACPWTSYKDQAEGKYGLALAQVGYRFAILGDGDQWVTHIGERTGKGY